MYPTQVPRGRARLAAVVEAVEPWIQTTARQLADAPLGETPRNKDHGLGEGGALGAGTREGPGRWQGHSLGALGQSLLVRGTRDTC